MKISWKIIVPVVLVALLAVLFLLRGPFKLIKDENVEGTTNDTVIGKFEKPTGDIDQSVDAILNYTDDSKIVSQEEDTTEAAQMDKDISGTYSESYENYAD